MAAILKRLSAPRLRAKIPPSQTQTSGSSSTVVPEASLTSSPPIPDDVEGDWSLSRSDLQNSMGNVRVEPADSMEKNAEMVIEVTVETSMEVIPIFSPTRIVLEMEANLPKESEAGAIKASGSFNSIDVVGAVELQRAKIPYSNVFPMRIQEEAPQTSSVPSSSPTTNNLRVVVDFLRRHVPLVDRLTLEGKNVQHQEKAANTNLIKEIDYSEKVIFKAQEVIDRKDDELSRACHRIKILEKQRLSADGQCFEFQEPIRVLLKLGFRKLAHYLNGFIENVIDLSKRMTKLKIQSTVLRKAKDQLSKEAAKTSDRAKEIEKKVLGVETALKKFMKKNVHLTDINGALEVEITKLKDRVVKAEASEVEALLLVKAAEEKALKVVDDFRMSDEFREEKASFALDAYDEEKRVVHEKITSKYPKLDLSFLNISSDDLS
ncbi:putative paramyosin-like [Cocos nucifera]|uniref:Putative paramyosin-like n=1 Tax=Cocos nucifera TaxID=13894 RepID=A0A8K0IQV8_COCNU|nr:putative paramyosin-like [Cocos nucifera]